MNEISKQITADKFLSALKKEHLSKKEAGDSIGLTAVQVSYLFNKNYWARLGNTVWGKVLKWINSGLSLKEYCKKKHDLPIETKHTEITISKEPDKKEEIPPTVKDSSQYPKLVTLLEEEKASLQVEINQMQMRLNLIDGLLPLYK